MKFKSIKYWLGSKWKKGVRGQANEITVENEKYCKNKTVKDWKIAEYMPQIRKENICVDCIVENN